MSAAVRFRGKTLSMGLGFFLWAMACFDGRRFGVCGKTVSALRRNVLSELVPHLRALGLAVTERADGKPAHRRVRRPGQRLLPLRRQG